MSRPLRVALVGVGSHARRNVLPAFGDAPGVDLVGVFSRDEAARGQASAMYAVRSFATAEAMLTARDVDAIYVCTPVGTHGEWIHRALDAGKHVICEKTLVESPKQTEAVLAHAEQLGLAVLEAFMFEHHPQWEVLRDAMTNGPMRGAHSLTARFGFPHLDPADVRYRADLGGGSAAGRRGVPDRGGGSRLR